MSNAYVEGKYHEVVADASAFITLINLRLFFCNHVLLLLNTDLDECSHNPCHENASCQSTAGDYVCECIFGFTGNGSFCEGEMFIRV